MAIDILNNATSQQASQKETFNYSIPHICVDRDHALSRHLLDSLYSKRVFVNTMCEDFSNVISI